jgi:hypothetical protein
MHVHIGAEIPGMGLTPPDPLDAPIAGPQWDASIERELRLYLANGVTTVRNMAGSPTTLRLMHRIDRGEVAGPRIYTASPIIDGDPPSNPAGAAHIFDRPRDAAEFVADLQRRGYQFLKVYNQLSAESYFALAAAARAIGMPVVGHVPFRVGLPGVLKAGQASVEHLRGYDFDPNAPPSASLSVDRFSQWARVSDETMRDNAQLSAAAGLYNCPTLCMACDGTVTGPAKTARAGRAEMALLPPELREYVRSDYIPEEIAEAIHSTAAQQKKMIRALRHAGAPLTAGTDSPLGMGVPGFELHREIELMVESGLSNYEALRTATVVPQEFFKKTLNLRENRGVIAPGFDADLVLIKENPLDNISSVRQIVGVMLRGEWWPVL